MQVWSLGQEDPLEKGMATPSSILAWRIPWTEEPGGLQSIGSQRVGQDWRDLACMRAHLGNSKDFRNSEPETGMNLLDVIPLVYFCFCWLSFWSQIGKTLRRLLSWSFFPVFSSRTFMVSGLMLKFVIYFELIFVYGVKRVAHFGFIFMWLSIVPRTIYWRDYLFPIVYFYLLYWTLIIYG